MYKLNLPYYFLKDIYGAFNDDLKYNSIDNEVIGFNNSIKNSRFKKTKIIDGDNDNLFEC